MALTAAPGSQRKAPLLTFLHPRGTSRSIERGASGRDRISGGAGAHPYDSFFHRSIIRRRAHRKPLNHPDKFALPSVGTRAFGRLSTKAGQFGLDAPSISSGASRGEPLRSAHRFERDYPPRPVTGASRLSHRTQMQGARLSGTTTREAGYPSGMQKRWWAVPCVGFQRAGERHRSVA